jgi:predicted RNA-binding Zn-ribbon protein involved in translation (DUF1610 family)
MSTDTRTQDPRAGTRAKCPHCGRMILIRKDGHLRQHFKPGTYYHCVVRT